MSKMIKIKMAMILLAVMPLWQACGGGGGGGGGNGGGGGSTTLTLETKPASLQGGSSTTFTAFITHNNGKFLGASWTLTSGGSNCSPACGSLSNHTNTGSSGNGDTDTILYTAPNSYSNSITITATSVENPLSSDFDTFTILGGPAVTTTSLPTGTVGIAYALTSLQATGGSPPYSWAVSSGSLPTGLSLTDGAISGTPTAAGTFSFTVQATDSAGATASASLSIVIVSSSAAACTPPLGNEAALDGQYAFLLQGFDTSGAPFAVAGTFTADGSGGISAGEEDLNTYTGNPAQNLQFKASSSLYAVGSDNRGCLQIATSAGTSNYSFALGSFNAGVAGAGQIISFDTSSASGAGVIELQDPSAFSTAQISGNYAFGVASTFAEAERFAAVGSFAASGGTISSGSADTNESGFLDVTTTTSFPTNPLGVTGTYSVDASGRGTMQLTIGGNTHAGVFYVVSAGELLLMATDAQTANPIFTGWVLQQSTGTFSNSSLTGTSVGYFSGFSSSVSGAKVEVSLIQGDGAGNLSENKFHNDGGTCATASASGTYSVAANGRVTSPTSGAPIFYMVGPNQAFGMSADTLVSFGAVAPQSAALFSDSSVSGTYAQGTLMPVTSNVVDYSGVDTFDGGGNFSATVDANLPGGTPDPGVATPGTYVVDSTGQGTIPASGTVSSYLFVISPSEFVSFSCGSANPSIFVYNQ